MATGVPSVLGAPSGPPGTVSTGPVALLLPLSGPLAPVGEVLENAAKLAIPDNAPALDIRDTGGTPQGAANAAKAAIAAGDGLILGPLTSAETKAVAPIAEAAHVDVLAFTNDGSVAEPGVWPLGITPAQQVRRVMQAATDAGRTQVAALLPDTDFGRALGTALQQSGDNPQLSFYEGGFSGLNETVKSMSQFPERGSGLMAEISAAKQLDTAAGHAKALELERQPIPAPPFNALFIGATSADQLAEIATLLPYYSVNSPQVQLLGPSSWSNVAVAMGSKSVYDGALYAGPDPAAAASFDAKYQAAYGGSPPAIANIGFDAAALAALLSREGGYSTARLTNPSGFSGTDGLLRLLPDGHVLRGLAVFQIEPQGPVISSPAPVALNPPIS